MKKTILALSLSAISVAAAAQNKAPEPDISLTGNFSLVSDYRFRGVSQTDTKPAGQGGFDVAAKSGLYAGTWTSNVSQWTATGASQEIDIYGGYKGTLPPAGIGFDIGYIAYQYPGNTASPKNNTRELYVGLSAGPVSYKLFRTTGNWFGLDNSSGSMYHDVTATFSLTEKVTLSAHIGIQNIKNRSEDFRDLKVGLTYDLGDGYAAGLAFTSVDLKDEKAGHAWFTNAAGKKLSGNGTVISLTKTF
ncbi:MAG: hypothetical protein FGM22_03705 [Burkholderiaceae bacterium]|jgi:uncharacterized protein (TIGR02001 family)|nr:hypothetical protein [Burkholderiaceae bacterium]